eukprot:TRINITY_DN4605_c0_g1_i1.p1 TRINITY_DN4605_c0_g1~~TRINITY_DN4605_c0_g1_i1.p1  ORF type:complete len:530 (+),score=120.15 TRINITY_DN4605_c0_g1_i1:1384-2973(+)
MEQSTPNIPCAAETDLHVQVFKILAMCMLGGVCAMVLYGNFLMIESHLLTLFMSLSCAAIICKLKPMLYAFVSSCGEIDVKHKRILKTVLLGSFAICAATVLFQVFRSDQPVITKVLAVAACAATLGVLLAPLLLETNTFVTIVLILACSAVIGGFVGIVGKNCVDETLIVSREVASFTAQMKAHVPATAPALFTLVRRNCVLLEKLHITDSIDPKELCLRYTQQLEDNLPDVIATATETIKSHADVFSSSLGAVFKSSLHFMTRISDFTFSIFLFATTLYYFVKFDRELSELLFSLSPLPKKQSVWVSEVVSQKVFAVFMQLGAQAIINFAAAILSFWLVGSPIVWVFGFLAGLLAVVPLVSSWFVWVPAAAWLLFRHGVFSYPWMVMTGIHLAAAVGVSAVSGVAGLRKQRPEVIGVGIILGIHAFGTLGLLFGPILAGLLLALQQMFIEVMHAPTVTRKHSKRAIGNIRSAVGVLRSKVDAHDLQTALQSSVHEDAAATALNKSSTLDVATSLVSTMGLPAVGQVA